MTKSQARAVPSGIDPGIVALGIQQPWAELILRGIKTLEIRSRNTQIRGPIYLYASQRCSSLPEAAQAVAEHRLDLESLPRGRLVGSVELTDSRLSVPEDSLAACLSSARLLTGYAWCLSAPQRFEQPLAVRFLPYGVWFYPYRRRS